MNKIQWFNIFIRVARQFKRKWPTVNRKIVLNNQFRSSFFFSIKLLDLAPDLHISYNSELFKNRDVHRDILVILWTGYTRNCFQPHVPTFETRRLRIHISIADQTLTKYFMASVDRLSIFSIFLLLFFWFLAIQSRVHRKKTVAYFITYYMRRGDTQCFTRIQKPRIACVCELVTLTMYNFSLIHVAYRRMYRATKTSI